MKEMLKESDISVLMKYADAGDRDAMHHFVTLCAMADDKELYSSEKCTEYIKKLAGGGSSVAYVQLAERFLNGCGVEKDVEVAMNLYQKAAEMGQIAAYGFMGLVYYKGKDQPQDYKMAYELFMKAGDKSNEVTYTLGEMYRLGQYVDVDMEKANACYQKVVDDGEFMPGSGLDVYFHHASERLKGNYDILEDPEW